MYEHIKKILKACPDPLRNKSLSSPNTSKLFEERKDVIPLNEGRRKSFHRLVAQILYLMKRTRPDISPKVPFLVLEYLNQQKLIGRNSDM